MPEATGPEASVPEPARPEASRNDAPFSFEAGLQQLETIVKEMEGGDLPLERALELFERGMKLSEACRKQLEEAETRIEILTRRAGEIQPQPFAPQRTSNDK
jgi:exodeoxyribonuclease VII small subunit